MSSAAETSRRNSVSVRIRLPKGVKAKLDHYAETAGVSLSTIIQVALGKAVSEWKQSRECPDCLGRGCGVCGGTGRLS